MASMSPRDVTLVKLRRHACWYWECMDDIPQLSVSNVHLMERSLRVLEFDTIQHLQEMLKPSCSWYCGAFDLVSLSK